MKAKSKGISRMVKVYGTQGGLLLGKILLNKHYKIVCKNGSRQECSKSEIVL